MRIREVLRTYDLGAGGRRREAVGGGDIIHNMLHLGGVKWASQLGTFARGSEPLAVGAYELLNLTNQPLYCGSASFSRTDANHGSALMPLR